MKFKRALAVVLSTMCFAGCANDPGNASEDAMAPDAQDSQDSQDAQEPSCTNDVIPFAALEAVSDQTVRDFVRASDGTIYFIATAGQTASTIGRREPCGEIEAWLEVNAPIADLEISADNQLYFAGQGTGTSSQIRARLFRIDLDDTSAVPQSLLDAPGNQIYSLSGAADGKMFFVESSSTERSIRYVDGDTVATAKAFPSSIGYTLVAASPAGYVTVFRYSSGDNLMGRLQLAANGTASYDETEIADRLTTLRADKNGGFYGFAVTGFLSQKDFRLVYGASVQPQTVVELVSAVQNAYVFYGLDGNASKAMLIWEKSTPAGPEISVGFSDLPVPVVLY